MATVKFSRRRAAGRAGLTLIELVVVLVVLIALAGILVPMLPGMLGRSHASAGATNIGEIAKAIQLHEALYNTHPNGYDSLINVAGDSLVDHTEVLGFNDQSASRIQVALNAVGITATHQLVDPNTGLEPWQINTFEAHSQTAIDLTANTGSVVVLEDHVEEDLNLVPSVLGGSPSAAGDVYAYVAFGVGALNTAVGKTMAEAPIHPPGDAGVSPTNAYSRYIAIYAIPAVGPARLASVAALHGDHLEGLGEHLAGYYELATQ